MRMTACPNCGGRGYIEVDLDEPGRWQGEVIATGMDDCPVCGCAGELAVCPRCDGDGCPECDQEEVPNAAFSNR